MSASPGRSANGSTASQADLVWDGRHRSARWRAR